MANRERVRDAIAGPVERATASLSELTESSDEQRLRAIVDGWGRGLAAGIEELAIALDELQRSLAERTSDQDGAQQPEPAGTNDDQANEADREQPSPQTTDATEDELRAQAVTSREATRALHEEATPKDDESD